MSRSKQQHHINSTALSPHGSLSHYDKQQHFFLHFRSLVYIFWLLVLDFCEISGCANVSIIAPLYTSCAISLTFPFFFLVVLTYFQLFDFDIATYNFSQEALQLNSFARSHQVSMNRELKPTSTVNMYEIMCLGS